MINRSQRAQGAILLLILVSLACSRSDQPLGLLGIELVGSPGSSGAKRPEYVPDPEVLLIESVPLPRPTPDPVRRPPAPIEIPQWYVVQYGDSINGIASRMGVGRSQIVSENGLINPDFLVIGQVLFLPTPIPQPPSPSFKIIPDSELVYGPQVEDFGSAELIRVWDGALYRHREIVDGVELSGVEVVHRVARKYSVNPRLLIGLIEYQSGWLTIPQSPPERLTYPLNYQVAGFEGLYSQLSWAADQLNQGFYKWLAGWSGPFILADGTPVYPGAGINAGTAALQWFFGQLYPPDTWRGVIDKNGFYRVYEIIFGNPFQFGREPLIPELLAQPEMQLPFEDGRLWSFTGGPHSAWGNWAAWAALDFAPPGPVLGCVQSNEWVVAVADGLVVRSSDGEVLQDLDGDGFEGSGWVIQYLHIETRDRVPEGTYLEAGERIGHPSCEGGISTGTHLHIARRYDGLWVAADGELPFTLDGWQSSGSGIAYNGELSRAGISLEACACRYATNQISR
jgi:murein DD-endopeptidase MepM/ murein hydrolase activator NlpD